MTSSTGLDNNNNNAVAYNYNRQYNQRANVFRGRVTDPDNNALPFANITNPVDNIGTYADANGNFILTSPDSVLSVQVRSIGFENRQYAMRSQAPSNQITLQEDRSLNARVLDTIRRVRSVASNTMIHEEPEPADGWNNYDTYIANNLQIPETVRMMDVGSSGAEVEVSFEVNRYGQPVNIKIVRSTCTKCEQEAIRLIKEGPLWKKKGRKSKTRVTLSF
ncbi:MAG: carboxypeptidase-like regulatory domain-containing protein [Chitinophagaceae bacterium]